MEEKVVDRVGDIGWIDAGRVYLEGERELSGRDARWLVSNLVGSWVPKPTVGPIVAASGFFEPETDIRPPVGGHLNQRRVLLSEALREIRRMEELVQT